MTTESPDVQAALLREETRAVVPGARDVWPWIWAALLAAFFLYVWLRVNPALVYHAHWVRPGASDGVPVFRFSAPFLRELLAPPGGPAECAAAFLSQYHQFAWLGAAIIAVLAAVLCLEAFVLLKAFGQGSPRLLHLVPVVPLLALYGGYLDPLPGVLALVLSLAGACLYVRLGWRGAPVRLAVFLALLALLYYGTAAASLVYVLLCALFEMTAGRRRILGLALLVLGGAVAYWMGASVFHLGLVEFLTRPLPFYGLDRVLARARAPVIRSSLLQGALYAFYPLAAAAAFALGRLGRRPRWLRVAGVVALTVVAGGVCAMHDGEMKAQTAVDYYASRRMWPEVLASARTVPFGTYDYLFVNCAVNRALYHTGRLGDDMFTYRQDPVGHMLCDKTLASLALEDRAWAMLPELLADLGCVNEAEHVACEAMQSLGDHPRLLEVAARCNLAKGRTGAARILLQAMGGDPVHGARARELLQRLEKDPLLADDPQIQHMRSFRLQQDVAGWRTVEDGLKGLLAQNGRNRMAFEYLMARYLIYGRLDEFVQEIGRLGEMGYERIPRHYEEALLVYAAQTGRAPDLGGLTISARTWERFAAFDRVLRSDMGRPTPAREKALLEYADTYMFYYRFLLPAGPTR